MSRTEHIIKRFQDTMGNSWWWRRYADMIDRKDEDGYKPFDKSLANTLVMTRRNKEKYANRMAMGLPIEHKLPYRARPENTLNVVPPMAPRDAGMTRQVQRNLYRQACKMAGVPFKKDHSREVPDFMRTMGYTKLPRRWRGMPEWQRKVEEEKLWQKFKAENVQVLDFKP